MPRRELHNFFFFLVFSRATLAAYGGSQAKGLIGAIAPGLHRATATQDPSHVCNLHHSSRQCQILNSLSEARDRTRILMDTSQAHYCKPQWELPYAAGAAPEKTKKKKKKKRWLAAINAIKEINVGREGADIKG